MSRFTTLALSAVSVLALTAVTAPVTDRAAFGGAGSAAVAGVEETQRTGNWCC